MFSFMILICLHTGLLNIGHQLVQLRSSISHNSIHLQVEGFQSLLRSHATLGINCRSAHRSGLKAPAEPSLPTHIIYQNHHLWRFFKNKYYLKSSHRLKAISGTLLIIVKSYNLILIAISLRLIKMSINRPGCGL